MARKKKPSLIKSLTSATFLLASVAGGVLFAFGLNDYIQQNWNAGVSVIVGAIITIVAVVSGWYTTETAFALKRK